MNKLLYLALAVALIGFGAYRQFGATGVSADDQARCERIVQADNAGSQEALDALLPKCNEPGMVAMMDARATGADAQTAASNIAAANQNDILSILINCALIGAGIGALGAALGATRKRA
ncbi:hypothetical protein [Paracoccus sulfuroxidans]|uniref:Uncharacterized protein n=1 Tax=Paracoccus sulfuroxidans TaxID=384678 RepID=A0A562NHE0_9RHOB|nr:hypothetical protein [Paracoccus sulfuroxidans]TWI31480.1 hypothetical protein IQ24_02931 [Paracoccus sulfuroxidans]